MRLAAQIEPIPGYTLLERLGRGGFGEVWKAEAPGGILKAIKFVYGDLEENTRGQPAEQELKALNRIKAIRHPYILSIERYDIVNGQLMIVMELADRNLFDRFRECQMRGMVGIPRHELLGYLSEAAEALDLMNNEYQIQHLDVKPQNLFLIHNHIKVADFGLAKDLQSMQATLTGGVTPVYAAPETFEGRISRYCDQYSLAIVYQELLTGRRPFDGQSAQQFMLQHLQGTPDLSPLPPPEQAVARRALAKSPNQRFANCTEFVEALRSSTNNAAAVSVKSYAPREAAVASPTGLTPIPSSTSGSVLGLELNKANRQLPQLGDRRTTATGKRRLSSIELPAAIPTVPEVAGSGILMPALVVGIGRIGLLVLQRLRRVIQDRFGIAALPNLRLLHIDTDAESVLSLNWGNAPATLDGNAIVLTRLNRPSHYLREEERLPELGAWLPPQLLYRIPRNPATTGIRAFGRLAFCDHYRAVRRRLRSELEAATADKAADEADQITRLGPRTNFPRVYVVTSLGGGTGSGMFLDLAYVLRRELKLLGYVQPDVRALLFLPPVDTAAPAQTAAVANAYGALKELFHFSSPHTTYQASLDGRDLPIVDSGPPFTRCEMLNLPAEGNGSRAAIGSVSGFLFRELLTSFGRQADRVRAERTNSLNVPGSFFTHGCYRITWPRNRLVQRAAALASKLLITRWLQPVDSDLGGRAKEWLESRWREIGVHPDALADRLSECCIAENGKSLQETIAAQLAAAGDQTAPSADTTSLTNVLQQIISTLGSDSGAPDQPKSPIAASMERAASAIGDEASQKIEQLMSQPIEFPGLRFAAADKVFQSIGDRIRAVIEEREPLIEQWERESAEISVRARAQIASLDGIGRGSRRSSAAKEAATLLENLVSKRATLLVNRSLVKIFRGLALALPEWHRALQLSRARIQAVLESMEDVPRTDDVDIYLGPGRAVLPGEAATLDEAAAVQVGQISNEKWIELDSIAQKAVESFNGKLRDFNGDKPERARELTSKIKHAAAAWIDAMVPNVTAAALHFQRAPSDENTIEVLADGFDAASPGGKAARGRDGEFCLLSVSDDADGSRLAQFAEQAWPGAICVPSCDRGDIVFYRERQLAPADLPQFGPGAREVYVQQSQSDQAPPHARFDIAWQSLHRG